MRNIMREKTKAVKAGITESRGRKGEPMNPSARGGKPDELDIVEKELLAQLAIVRALKPLASGARFRVLQAVLHLHEADLLVPGIFDVAAGKAES